MAYDPEKHHRRSIRLKGHDYAGGGTYFVTLCAHREAGNIFADEAAKEILSRIWEEIALEAQGGGEGRTQGLQKGLQEGQTQGLPVRAGFMSAPSSESFPAYCIMPDHFHALIRIRKGEKALGDFLCAFKSRTTLEYIRGVKAGRFPPFKKKIWHRNYYEMVVRSADAEAKIAEYIRMNPWKCVQNLGNGLRGIGNPALWNGDKLGVLCSRNAPVGQALCLPCRKRTSISAAGIRRRKGKFSTGFSGMENGLSPAPRGRLSARAMRRDSPRRWNKTAC